MKVWILMRHVDYEFGAVLSVHSTETGAKGELERLTSNAVPRRDRYPLDELEIEEREVDTLSEPRG